MAAFRHRRAPVDLTRRGFRASPQYCSKRARNDGIIPCRYVPRCASSSPAAQVAAGNGQGFPCAGGPLKVRFMTEREKVEALHKRLLDEQRRLILAAADVATVPAAGAMARTSDLELTIEAADVMLDEGQPEAGG